MSNTTNVTDLVTLRLDADPIRLAVEEVFDANALGHVSGGFEHLGYLVFSDRYVVEVQLHEPLTPHTRPNDEQLNAAGFSRMEEWKPDPWGEQIVYLYVAA